MINRTCPFVATAVVVLSVAAGTATGQESKSGPVVKQLTQTLDSAKLDAIAAADPADPGTFVAALYIQGSQLLVVSAKYAAPPLLTAKLKAKAGTQQVTFDGEWEKAKLTEDAYKKAFADADQRYIRILELLTAQAKQ